MISEVTWWEQSGQNPGQQDLGRQRNDKMEENRAICQIFEWKQTVRQHRKQANLRVLTIVIATLLPWLSENLYNSLALKQSNIQTDKTTTERVYVMNRLSSSKCLKGNGGLKWGCKNSITSPSNLIAKLQTQLQTVWHKHSQACWKQNNIDQWCTWIQNSMQAGNAYCN